MKVVVDLEDAAIHKALQENRSHALRGSGHGSWYVADVLGVLATDGEPATGWQPVDKNTARVVCAEGVHTALRKGTGAEGAHKAWKAISKIAPGGWEQAIGWFVWSLDYMGLKICRKADDART